MDIVDLMFGLLFLAPLMGFLVNGYNFKKSNALVAGIIGTSAIGISFFAAVFLFTQMLNSGLDLGGGTEAGGKVLTSTFLPWLSVGSFEANFGFLMDPISGIMTLIITGVGALIHMFSVGYMSHDKSPFKYFAYLNLFIFNMLLLVLGDNLLVTFVGWEGVGLCSYLLIGFWFTDEQKASAGMKAFITNRVGDAGLLIGIFLLFSILGTVNYYEMNQYAGALDVDTSWTGPLTWAMLFLFIGVTGKSAQIPLHVWLPDAMAGPTPVSALIHAATMVTAGVYLLIRLSSVLVLAPHAMTVIACVGALTALLGATVGITQWDIKKILAYSTVSQLGYMILGVGVGAFIPAFFHLITHAFFKALLFLGSGSVIHSMNEEQDIRKMGGLARLMPITSITFLIGYLAIMGIPPFSGFFSKDEILFYVFASSQGSVCLWILGLIGAGCTAFYMTRLMALTFWGKSRVEKNIHPHESPKSMTGPLIVLALLAAFGGFLGIPHFIGSVLPGHPPNVLEHLLQAYVAQVDVSKVSVSAEWGLMFLSVLVALLSAMGAYMFYLKRSCAQKFGAQILCGGQKGVQLISRPLNTLLPVCLVQKWNQQIGKGLQKVSGGGKCLCKLAYNLSFNKYFIDEIYFSKIINPLVQMSKALWLYIDVMFIDKITYLATDMMKSSGESNKSIQNGNFQTYAFISAVGICCIFIVLFAIL